MPLGITEDGFAAFSGEFVKDNTRSDGFAYMCGMKLKSDGVSGMFDKEKHLTGIRIEFSDFVIGEATDYSDAERHKIREMMLRHNENISRLISSVTEIYGGCSRCSFGDGDTDFYFTDVEGSLAEWNSDKGMMSLKYSNRSSGTGCRMTLILERRKPAGQ